MFRLAEIKAFKGLVYNTKTAGNIEQLTCPPYDIISERERNEYLSANPHNVVRLELPSEQNGMDKYLSAAEVLTQWQSQEILVSQDEESLYIYEESFEVLGKAYSFKSLICRVKLSPFSEGVVLPHEQTLSKAKQDRLNLMKSTNCNFSQIYSLYFDDKNEDSTALLLDDCSKKLPIIHEFTDDSGVTHKLWQIIDSVVIDKISRQFKDRKLYIADGHHRYETALNYKNHLNEIEKLTEYSAANYVMMAVVDIENSGLVVFPTHRIVRDLQEFDVDSLLSKLRDNFEIAECNISGCEEIAKQLDSSYEKGEKAFILYTSDKRYHKITLRDISVMDKFMPDMSDASKGLDVNVLHTLILEDKLGIDKENMANQINLTYTRDIEEAISNVDRGKANCAFLLNPTKTSEIADVASVGEKMPQKSTYFYPKLITGLVMNDLSV